MPRGNGNDVVEALTAEITQLIESGQLRAGDRLPTERDLAGRYQASRAVVRRALESLERNGRIIRHVGRGTFVADPAPRGAKPLVASPTSSSGRYDVSPADLAVARTLFEPVFTEYAAIHATMADLERIRDYLLKSEDAPDSAGFDYWDREMHTAIAAAAHNSFIMLIMDAVNEIRSSAEWGKISVVTATEARRQIHSRDHRAIVEALFARDATAAREAMQRHLDNVTRLMRGGSVSVT
ncbi:MAG: FadR/GntR family transcriptional regulator [Rhizobiaceae bacterium]